MEKALLLLLVIVFGGSFFGGCSSQDDKTRILVFTKTEGFRHGSIPYGVDAIRKLGEEHGFLVNQTEDASVFEEDSLKEYDAIIFLNTTGNILNPYQQAFLERYIQAGGGFMGIHAAANTEDNWPWYGKMLGAYFKDHPPVQHATLDVIDAHHPSTDSLPTRWQRTDEWYNYEYVNEDVHVLMNLDEETYEGGKHGKEHPIAWYHEYDGGRVFYAGGGHTAKSFSEPLFLYHLWGGIRYVLGKDRRNELDYSRARTLPVPEENRFEKVVLDNHFNEPMELEVLDENRILFIERHGNVKLYNVAEDTTKVIASLKVHTGFEDGLLGLAADPDFEQNHWVYLYYSPAGPEAKQHLSRFTMRGDSLDLSSEQLILTVPTQREECCHSGSSLEFGPEGHLYISIGDNTNPFGSNGYAPLDERPGRTPWDDQRTAANTNDLRGKILRIHPDTGRTGSYSIPEGNLFDDDRENTRPEIYVMGNRNPYRISIDPKTGYLYWGDVGPDAGSDHELRGPRGHDEINQARQAGFFGWPYFIADNKPYGDYDFATEEHGSLFDPDSPLNYSANNTGIQDLPPAQDAFVWYPYAASKEFPLTGSGGRTSMAGPVYYADLYEDHPAKFPDYYDGKLFIYEWTRNWIRVVTMDKNRDYVSMEPFMAGSKFSRPVDMQFGPDGRLYMLEYGRAWKTANPDSRLVRIDYNPGNRTPIVRIDVPRVHGAAPFTVEFSAKSSEDYDGDGLNYKWNFGSGSAGSSDVSPTFTYEEPGIYMAELTVTDEHGASSTATVDIQVGNEPPRVSVNLEGNHTFYFAGEERAYHVQVADKEDGMSESGSINLDEVVVEFRYMNNKGLNEVEVQDHQSAAVSTLSSRRLIETSDCQACHTLTRDLTGPSFRAVAQKYQKDKDALKILATKIIEGGSGNWGERPMPAHPELGQNEAEAMIRYILSVNQKNNEHENLPLKGTVITPQPDKNANEGGGYVLRATYTDRGGYGITPLSVGEAIVLREPKLSVFEADAMQIAAEYTSPEDDFNHALLNDGSWLRFDSIDLTGIGQLEFFLTLQNKNGSIKVRSGSVDGSLMAAVDIPAGQGRYKAIADLPESEEIHDVYIVVSSEEHIGQTLFLMDSLRFQNKY